MCQKKHTCMKRDCKIDLLKTCCKNLGIHVVYKFLFAHICHAVYRSLLAHIYHAVYRSDLAHVINTSCRITKMTWPRHISCSYLIMSIAYWSFFWKRERDKEKERERERERESKRERRGGEHTYVYKTGWQNPWGCLKLHVIFRNRATDYRALLRKMNYKDKAFYASLLPCTRYKYVY